MPRYKFTIEYHGEPFCGWQIQDQGQTVQGQIEIALTKFTKETPKVHGSGRTDSGVHALGQVAHINLENEWDPQKLREALNYHLKPDPIAILECEIVSDDFEARFSATERHYVYKIINRRAPLVVDKGLAWWVKPELDLMNMQEAAKYLEGHHDFTTFRSVHCQAKSPLKSVNRVHVEQYDDEFQIEVSARSFMHNQVRSFVGSLKNVGEGRWEPVEVKHALEAADRSRCGEVAPAHGLYLTQVDY